MAEDQQENAAEENKEKKGGSKKKIMVLVLLGLIIAGISVGGTLVALKFLGGNAPEIAEDDVAAEDAPPPPPPPAIYYPIKPPIIVNFDVKGRQRYLQAEITLMLREDDVISAIELHMSMVRNALILMIGGQLYEELLTAEGKELLRQQCLQELQRIMEQEIGKPGVEQVLFTNFVMQ